jgi:type III pantothenate kinase
MTALFDGGNSRLHFAWWDSGSVRGVIHAPYPESGDAIPGLIENLLGGEVPRRIAACSVSPRWGEPLFAAIEARFPGAVCIVRSASDAGVTVRYDRPGSYGVDRALAALAAYRMVKSACVVVDAGTAVTVDAVDGDGVVRGGYIFPGIEALAHGLAAMTGLPLVHITKPEIGIGTDTLSCIERGIAAGIAGAVRFLIESAAGEVKGGDQVIITGGGGEFLMRELSLVACFRPHLVLEGLGFISDFLEAGA